MYIKNQTFSDEDTLFETLFDFELGDASPYTRVLQAEIEKEIAADTAYQALLAEQADEEDRMELEDEERRERLAVVLQERFRSFKVAQKKFYGVSESGEETLLWEIDLV